MSLEHIPTQSRIVRGSQPGGRVMKQTFGRFKELYCYINNLEGKKKFEGYTFYFKINMRVICSLKFD